ncbi:MarP family serine protease [Agilicoccus flavus]|uniref:MarP family serine protease n=1 Tax=Agilicoccus flavus TaxID=2775968 RepID=UPI001CF65242|nr:MarP family serine protease [Agilicoccus flavus]
MNVTVFDAGLVVIVVLYVLLGARRGVLLTLASIAGFVAGAAAGLSILPRVLVQIVPDDNAALRPVLLLVLVLVLGAVGQSLLTRLVGRVHRHVRTTGWRVPDALLGGLLTGALALTTLWLAAGLLRAASPQVLGRAVSSSQVLEAVDGVMPTSSERVVGRAVIALDGYGFPRVFDGISAEPLTPVDRPVERGTVTQDVRAASRSVLRIDALSVGCGASHEGTGWVVSRGLVVTNAHVVAGAERVTVREGAARRDGTVVAFDPDRDLAVISVPDLTASPLRLGAALDTGDPVAVPGYPLGGPLTIDSARVRDELDARGNDIYGSGTVRRQVYSLRAQLQPGNSGGPVLTPDGEVAGVVFARSLDHDDTGYALTLDELRPVLDEVGDSRIPVGTGRCAA